jgi:hypothetical protein
MKITCVGLLVLAACPPSQPSLDVSSPTVVTVAPSNGATGVALTTTPQVCFNEPMTASSLTSTTVVLSRTLGSTSTAVVTTVAVDPTGLCANLYPPGQLSPSSGYKIEVTTGALSAAGVEITHAKYATSGFTSSFFTAGQPAQASLWVPANGTLTAPLDLAQVLVSFSLPLGCGAPQPLILTPPGGTSGLAGDGLSATAPLPQPLVSGEPISVALSSALTDSDGNPPVVPGSLGFQIGSCAEGSPPSVSDGTPIARDRDALLLYQVDRPCLCGAVVAEPGCPGATALITPATCQAPYDPCQGGLLCFCQVPLVDLCPSGTAQVTPQATGWNGQVGTSADAAQVQLADPLPPLVVDELLLSPEGTRASGEFIEVVNLGAIPLDLLGIVLANCAGSTGCAIPKATQAFGAYIPGGPTAIPPFGYALLVDSSFNPAQAASMPPGTLLLSPLDGAPLLALSTTEPQPVALFAAGGAGPPLSTFDGSLTAVKGLSAERIDPSAPDPLPGNWALSASPGGTPGSCNSVTPASECAEARSDGGQP